MAPSREASDTGRNWQDADAGLRPTERVGVLLLNLGGPETLADVQPFLYNLFADDSIIRLPPYGEDSTSPAQMLYIGISFALCNLQICPISCACKALVGMFI